MKPISFPNNLGLTLRGYIHVPKKYDTAIIFLHGFPSHCSGFTASRLARLSVRMLKCLFLCFDFSGTHTSDGKFENKLMSQEVKDIKAAIDFLAGNYQFKKLILIGHSTGAIDASLYAHKDQRIHKLILLGAESDTKHSAHYDFTDQQIHDFWTKGYIRYHAPGRWYHHKRLKKAFYDEFFTLDIPKAIKKYKRPLLIIHGEKDEAVPSQDAQELYKMANRPKRLMLVKGSDHRFSKVTHFLKVAKEIYRFVNC